MPDIRSIIAALSGGGVPRQYSPTDLAALNQAIRQKYTPQEIAQLMAVPARDEVHFGDDQNDPLSSPSAQGRNMFGPDPDDIYRERGERGKELLHALLEMRMFR